VITSTFKGIRVAGVAAALPTRKVCNLDYAELFGKETVEKIIASTGVEESYHLAPEQTSSDLACAAAAHLLRERNIQAQSVDILIYVGVYPDYFVPGNAFVLQKRLGLPKDSIVFDVSLACSGFVYGLQICSALLSASSAKRALLLVGDSTSKTVSPLDTSRLLFGDGGGAMLLEKEDGRDTSLQFGMKSDGSRFKTIIVPAGGFRLPAASSEMMPWGDGNKRSDYNLYMNGTDVFSFTMTDVPDLFREFMEHYGVTPANFDALIMHQPNRFILRHLAKKIKVPMDKVPLSLDRYGNTSVASIPVTLCDAYGDKNMGEQKLMLAGFGVGLSWAVATLSMDTNVILPIIHTDEFYKDGGVSHA